MTDEAANAEIMRAIGRMEAELPASWTGSSMWADLVQESADLIRVLGDRLSPMQLAVLMTFGAMAHRQCKIERAAEQEEAGHG